MEDNDMYPCVWCRGEMISCQEVSYIISGAQAYAVMCDSCGMSGPIMPTQEEARQVYCVVAKLVDDVIRARATRFTTDSDFSDEMHQVINTFMQERREHAPY